MLIDWIAAPHSAHLAEAIITFDAFVRMPERRKNKEMFTYIPYSMEKRWDTDS